jgi:hypothetical protein
VDDFWLSGGYYLIKVRWTFVRMEMIAMEKWLEFHMQLVFSVDTWQNHVRSMEMGASNT